MAKKRRQVSKKIEPPLPEIRPEPLPPKYFNLIRGGGGLGSNLGDTPPVDLPRRLPKTGTMPEVVPKSVTRSSELDLPRPLPEPEKVPLLIRAARRFRSLLVDAEPERPETIPTIPELSYPGLTRSGGTGEEKPAITMPEQPTEPEKVPLLIRAARRGGSLRNEMEPERSTPMPSIPLLNRLGLARRGRGEERAGPTMPAQAQEPQKVPLLIKAARHFKSLLVQTEPERPETIPTIPELNYPALYTRYPVMKTVTKTTDALGEMSVTYSHSFATIPGVVITVKDPDNVFGTVFSTTLTGFEARMFKIDHDHGGTVDDGGLHTPTINADGEHQHEVTGVINWTEYGKWGRLVTTGNYTEYENNHVHPNPTTGSEAAHTHNNPNTETTANHQHTIPATDGPDDTDVAVNGASWGSDCAVGVCVVSFYTHGFAEDSHFHLNTGKKTGWDGSHYHVQAPTLAGSSHTHTMGDTGQQAGLGHRHPISNDTMYQRYMTSVAITADLWVSAEESPHHAHSGAVVPVHGHVVPSDGRVLLKNTNVTIMYLAQEESS